MKADQNNIHKELVNLWEEQNTKDLRDEQLIHIYGSAFQTIEKCCLATLSRVTINVVIDRVLHLGSEKFPILSMVAIESSGLSIKGLIQNNKNYKVADPEEIREAFGFILVEFLTVISSLTSDVLTASLHKGLKEVSSESVLKILEVQSLYSVNSTKIKRGEE